MLIDKTPIKYRLGLLYYSVSLIFFIFLFYLARHRFELKDIGILIECMFIDSEWHSGIWIYTKKKIPYKTLSRCQS